MSSRVSGNQWLALSVLWHDVLGCGWLQLFTHLVRRAVAQQKFGQNPRRHDYTKGTEGPSQVFCVGSRSGGRLFLLESTKPVDLEMRSNPQTAMCPSAFVSDPCQVLLCDTTLRRATPLTISPALTSGMGAKLYLTWTSRPCWPRCADNHLV